MRRGGSLLAKGRHRSHRLRPRGAFPDRVGSRLHFVKGFVVRRPDAYPVYSRDYREPLRIVQDYLAGFENLLTIGRAGLFRYCNSDLALKMGFLAADRILGLRSMDPWDMGREQDYLE